MDPAPSSASPQALRGLELADALNALSPGAWSAVESGVFDHVASDLPALPVLAVSEGVAPGSDAPRGLRPHELSRWWQAHPAVREAPSSH